MDLEPKLWTIAEVFHLAADEFLYYPGGTGSEYSCFAIIDVLVKQKSKNYTSTFFNRSDRIFEGLQNLGLDPNSATQFDYVSTPGRKLKKLSLEERQEYRYSWLKFCAMLAEEQGV